MSSALDHLDASSNTGRKLCKWDCIGNGKLSGDKEQEKIPIYFQSKMSSYSVSVKNKGIWTKCQFPSESIWEL